MLHRSDRRRTAQLNLDFTNRLSRQIELPHAEAALEDDLLAIGGHGWPEDAPGGEVGDHLRLTAERQLPDILLSVAVRHEIKCLVIRRPHGPKLFAAAPGHTLIGCRRAVMP